MLTKKLHTLCVVLLSTFCFAISFEAEAQSAMQTGSSGIGLLPGTKLRIVSYNGYFTSIFPKDDGSDQTDTRDVSSVERTARFAKWAPQARADIWIFQEILYKNSATGTTIEGIVAYFNQLTQDTWYGASDDDGRIILSRYPISWSSEDFGNGHAALIDLPQDIADRKLLIVNQHFSSGSTRAEERAAQAAATADFINTVKSGTHPYIQDSNPFIMVAGDFNSGAGSPPYKTVMKLEPHTEESDLKPNHFLDVKPKEIGLDDAVRSTFGTIQWTGEIGNSPYIRDASRIDFALLPLDFLPLQQTFLFNSLLLPEELLNAYGVDRDAILLRTKNSNEIMDHLPIFLDFK